jgi:hypothetical protein
MKPSFTDKSVDNRKPWQFKPGNNANPGGRPKGATITSFIRRELEKKVPGDTQSRTYKQLFAQAMIKHAINGHSAAMGYILDRVDGRIPSEFKGEISETITVEAIRKLFIESTMDVKPDER